ncbi:hypothetical protein [Janibacter indicus]|uniref:hypothetical protein n=1 Tax=Janibacter indicus TaxID=857417 RepID=UPI000F77AF25|nr:hypothetical protein [Janibacter indicus]
MADLVTSTGGRAGSETQLPVYSVTKHAGFVPSREYFKKQVFSRDVANYKMVERGDFAYATIHLDEGSIGIAPERGLISPMYTVFRADAGCVDSGYLLRFLKSPFALARYSQLGRGAIHRRKAISLEALGGLPVPLPSLDEQRRIAAILDHTDALRAKRRQVLAHLDYLAQAIFHEVAVGVDQVVSLGNLGVGFASGKNVVAAETTAHPVNRVIKVSAISSGRFNWRESKEMPCDYSPPAGHLIRKGDVLFGRASGSLGLLGATAVVPDIPDCLYLPDKVWRLEVPSDGAVLKSYVLGALRSPSVLAYIRHHASGAAGVRNIARSKLLECPIPVPSLESQRRYGEAFERLEEVRKQAGLAEVAADELFASLQARAFRGEL